MFSFKLQWADKAKETYSLLKDNKSQSKLHKDVKKTLKFLATDPHHNSLQTDEYMSLKGPNGEKVFEAYAEKCRFLVASAETVSGSFGKHPGRNVMDKSTNNVLDKLGTHPGQGQCIGADR